MKGGWAERTTQDHLSNFHNRVCTVLLLKIEIQQVKTAQRFQKQIIILKSHLFAQQIQAQQDEKRLHYQM